MLFTRCNSVLLNILFQNNRIIVLNLNEIIGVYFGAEKKQFLIAFGNCLLVKKFMRCLTTLFYQQIDNDLSISRNVS